MGNTNDARMLSPEAQADLRRRVAHAVVDRGMGESEAARTFEVRRTLAHHWCKAYRSGGDAALAPTKRSLERSSRLLPHQVSTIVRLIDDRQPDRLQLPFVLWTREAVGDLIRQRYDIDLSVWTVGRYLKRRGFTPHPGCRPCGGLMSAIPKRCSGGSTATTRPSPSGRNRERQGVVGR